MTTEWPSGDEPCYVISIAARIVGVHVQTLRYYERVGLLKPSRSQGRRRLYSPRNIEKLRRIKTLTDDLGINLAGVEVVLRLMDRLLEMEYEISRLRGDQNKPQLHSSTVTETIQELEGD